MIKEGSYLSIAHVAAASDPGSAMSWSANQWGEQWELQGPGIVMGSCLATVGCAFLQVCKKKLL